MKTYIYIIALLIGSINMTQAQEIRYVTADNGLNLRVKPDKNASRVTKLDYGTKLRILEHTNEKLSIRDNGEVISGEWVKVMTLDDEYTADFGYVFNGYLAEDEFKKRFKIKFDRLFTLQVEPIDALIFNRTKDTVNVELGLGETIEGNTIKISHHIDYKKIEVFQKHENSISIMDEGPHCDLTSWKHYHSSWVPLTSLSGNRFKTNTYAPEAQSKFLKVDINEFKAAAKEHCGDDWAKLVKDVKSINEWPSMVAMSTIYLRVVFTNMNDEQIEKIITFEIPMGC